MSACIHPAKKQPGSASRIAAPEWNAETLKQILEPFFPRRDGRNRVGIVDNRGTREEEWQLDPHPQQESSVFPHQQAA
jgi:hypothetical protein